jgi:glycerol-3-phosphate dehydrogenase
LTFSFAIAAAQHGAVLANHTEAVGLIVEGGRIVGARARDRLASREFDISALVTVNATGGAVDRLLDPIGAPTRIPMLKAMNLVTRREAGAEALGGPSPSGRHLFLVPWRGRALFGTWESSSACRPDQGEIVEADVAAFIDELNRVFPRLQLTSDDVSMIHRGVVPAIAVNGGLSLEGHERICDHAREGPKQLEGLVSVVGAKYTTARAVAERVTNGLVAKLRRQAAPCRTATTPLPGGDLADVPATIEQARQRHRDIPADTLEHLVAAYGSRYHELLSLCAIRPDLKVKSAEDSPVIGAELVWAAREEMAATLADAVIRRTPLGALGYPGDLTLDRAAELVGNELGWPHDRRLGEIAAVRRFYSDVVRSG